MLLCSALEQYLLRSQSGFIGILDWTFLKYAAEKPIVESERYRIDQDKPRQNLEVTVVYSSLITKTSSFLITVGPNPVYRSRPYVKVFQFYVSSGI